MRVALRITAAVLLLAGCHHQSHMPYPEPPDAGPRDAAPATDAAGDDAGAPPDAALPLDAGPPPPARLVAERTVTCVLAASRATCWGTMPRESEPRPPHDVPELAGAIDVAFGATFWCAVLRGGEVVCAGSNRAGQIARAPSDDILPPSVIPGVGRAVDVAVMGASACALTETGAVICWGDNSVGQLARPIRPHPPGAASPEHVPMAIEGIPPATSVACGSYHCCAALADGGLRCWGYDIFGQLGAGGDAVLRDPGLEGVVETFASANTSCALLDDGSARCWGRNSELQCGFPHEESDSCTAIVPHPCALTPHEVDGVERAEEMGFDGLVGCARDATGTLACWGDPDEPALGDASPVPAFEQLAVGRRHVCVMDASAQVFCRGSGTLGELGVELESSTSFVAVPLTP